MSNCWVIIKRELGAYFSTPLAYVFIVIFLALSGALTFFMGAFFERGQADLASFFSFHPWLYLFLIPAVSMRLWAEERKTGTVELLLTLPTPTWVVVIGKYLAAWAFIGIALVLTFPLWITVNFLGTPDNGVIVASYLGSLVMAGGYLAIGSCLSAVTKNQVIAFILTAVVCFLFLMSGVELVQSFFQGWAPSFVLEALASMSFLTHFNTIIRGVIDLRDVVFFGSIIGVFLYFNAAVIDLTRGS
ncbi:MAG: ABC transporter permease [Rhodospirillales bacterium]|jgi:ABC-2 type transport system permease protein|nr:ABC transporter permease [Rhodospirillales bacterium]MDP7101753.1 ABC transporter permease [Rhodospirillales bacterium]MDP7425886.1 ABC transporter permease [Rhodospirillales bacterium]MDP7624883.1 ABC transporter permease [Rhodospirillales bacterium]HJO85580.1 ABC transporter permease [Rhodospirillales bacterium]|tara:strand:+ start:986 stop:1720 length:735 start_codon:yes stop_codon:yes gene_type:complete